MVKPVMKSPIVWANIIADWKTGEYTQQQLADKYNVSYGTICNRLSDLGVKKGELVKQIEAKISNKYERALVARGFDEHKVAQLVGMLLEAEKRDPENPKKKVADLYHLEKGLTHLEKLVGIGKENEQAQQNTPVQIKIMINNTDAPINPSGIITDVSYTEINI